jgi:hypothetical protein
MGRRNVVVAGLLGLTVAGGTLLVSGEEPVDADKTDAEIKAVAERVERLRGLQFERAPKVRHVSSRQLRKEAAKQQAELSGKDLLELEADGELLKLLGFIDREADLASSVPDTTGIAGTYEFKNKQLTIVNDVPKSDIPPELVYAHELNHALEDQIFGLGDPNAGGDDTAQAWRALGEGTATFLEARYAREHLGADITSKKLAKADPASTEKASSSGQAYGENSERFAYMDGVRFVARLHRKGGWKLVNRAINERPPKTTEEILHPDAYLAGEKPAKITLDTGALDKKHNRLAHGQLGEFDTSQMLLLGAKADDDLTRKDAATAAEGWDGGRYELWQGDANGVECSQPCVERDVLVLAWSWDSPEEVAEFVALLPGYLERFQKMRPAGPARWKGKSTAAALTVTERETTLVFAPKLEQAQQLATSVRK